VTGRHASGPDTPSDPDGDLVRERRDRATAVVRSALDSRDAAAFVHAGTGRDPGLRYLRPTPSTGLAAVAYDGVEDEWLVGSTADGADAHPADRLAAALADRGLEGPVLTPPRVPHDAALYLERAGFEPASTDALERARATKTAGERDRIAAAQRAAGAGIRRAASLLSDARGVDGRPALDESGGGTEPLTPARLRTAIDEAIVGAGAFPAGNTAVDPDSSRAPDDPLRPGEPVVLAATPREPAGYYGRLVRTLVVDGDGGRERRVHVAVTQSFRSARSLLTVGSESVAAVAADLEAEVRSFGFDADQPVETAVAGVGLEPRERPLAGGDAVGPGSVVRLDVTGAVGPESRVRIADVVAITDDGDRPDRFAAPSRSLSPAALLE
jgi:Xaa-Pro aminopeptidase